MEIKDYDDIDFLRVKDLIDKLSECVSPPRAYRKLDLIHYLYVNFLGAHKSVIDYLLENGTETKSYNEYELWCIRNKQKAVSPAAYSTQRKEVLKWLERSLEKN